MNKRIDDEKKTYKKIEYENNNLVNNVKEMETQIATTYKFVEEKKKEKIIIIKQTFILYFPYLLQSSLFAGFLPLFFLGNISF